MTLTGVYIQEVRGILIPKSNFERGIIYPNEKVFLKELNG